MPRVSPRIYQAITVGALVALVLIVVTGGAVRLTGSGLGCSDWPGCSADRFVPASGFHDWMEFGNRLVTAAVSAFVIVAVLTAALRTPVRRDLVWLSVGLVVGVVAQILLGAVVVYSDLNPVLVQGHFIVSMLLVLDAVVLVHRARLPDERSPDRPSRASPVPDDVRLWARIMVGLTAATTVVGTAVTGAGPHSGQNDGKFVQRLDVAVRDVARVHSSLALLLLGAVLFTVWRLRRSPVGTGVLARAELVLTAVVLQGVVGYTQYFTKVPPLLVGLHILGVSVLWVAVLWFLLGLSPAVTDPPRLAHAHQPADASNGAELGAGRGSGADLVTER